MSKDVGFRFSLVVAAVALVAADACRLGSAGTLVIQAALEMASNMTRLLVVVDNRRMGTSPRISGVLEGTMAVRRPVAVEALGGSSACRGPRPSSTTLDTSCNRRGSCTWRQDLTAVAADQHVILAPGPKPAR